MNRDDLVMKQSQKQVWVRFSRPMDRNYITKAAANAATALSMAKEIYGACSVQCLVQKSLPMPDGIQDLVQIIDNTARMLIRRCRESAADLDVP